MMYVSVDAGETALLSLVFPLLYCILFFFVVGRRGTDGSDENDEELGASSPDDHHHHHHHHHQQHQQQQQQQQHERSKSNTVADATPSTHDSQQEFTRDHNSGLTLLKRAKIVVGLLHYIAPLAVVFFAEYTIISGLWSSLALGSIASSEDRHSFYVWSYFMYQCGVFVSRSSGVLIKADTLWLYLVPAFQCVLLGLFAAIAATQFWTGWWVVLSVCLCVCLSTYRYRPTCSPTLPTRTPIHRSLLAPCFVVGCFGGFSYVQTYAHMSDSIEESRKEMAIAAATVGENFGTTLASALSIAIQAALWARLGIDGGP